MISFLETIIPYISGLYTLPWILVGFLGTIILSKIFSPVKVDLTMKNIALILLYLFVPPLVFRIFLDTPLGTQEGIFVIVVALSIALMYWISYLFAHYQIRRQGLSGTNRTLYIKTVVTNQGRSSAFVGGIMLVIPSWGVPAGIFMAMFGIALFAVVPFILSNMNKKEKQAGISTPSLPWFLRYYPLYFIIFPIAGLLLQKSTGISTQAMGDWGTVIRFYTALTIPAALYYVGSGIHPGDLKITELKKLVGLIHEEGVEHWAWVRQIFILTAVITPLIFAVIFGVLLSLKLIPPAWFVVTVINAILPITSTNMFLIPYGIDKRATAHSITWSTLICVPIVIILISIFSIYLT